MPQHFGRFSRPSIMDHNRALNHHRTHQKTEAGLGWRHRSMTPVQAGLDQPVIVLMINFPVTCHGLSKKRSIPRSPKTAWICVIGNQSAFVVTMAVRAGVIVSQDVNLGARLNTYRYAAH